MYDVFSVNWINDFVEVVALYLSLCGLSAVYCLFGVCVWSESSLCRVLLVD